MLETHICNAPTVVTSLAVHGGAHPRVKWGVRTARINDMTRFQAVIARWGLHLQGDGFFILGKPGDFVAPTQLRQRF